MASAAVVALLVLSAGSVAADTTGPGGDQTFSQNGKSADANAGDCVSNGDGTTTCWDVGISAFAGKLSDNISGVSHSSQVCAWHNIYTFDDVTGEVVGQPLSEAGCKVDLSAAALKFGTKLSSVTLAPTIISIAQWTCVDKEGICEPGPSRDVTVAGTWTGVGPTSFSKYAYSGNDGICRYAESGKGYDRQATFTGSLAGQSFDTNAYGSIRDGKSTYRSRCVGV